MFKNQSKFKFGIFALLFLFICIIAISNPALASETLKMSISKANIYFNNELKQSSEELPLLNYNNRTYVPLRYFAESSGSFVGYDNESKTINIDTKTNIDFKSQQINKSSDGDFELSIMTSKKNYKYGEALSIWSELTYQGNEERTITHGDPLLYYTITDSDGEGISDYVLQSSIPTEFAKDDEVLRIYSDSLNVSYNIQKNKIVDPIEYLNSAERPSRLPPGEYIISVTAGFDGSRHLTTELKIIIEK